MISDTKILRLSFNQNRVRYTQTLLFVGTNKGFRAVCVRDGELSLSREHFEGGFACAAPMFSTQLVCLVGSMLNVGCPPNVVYLWDEDHAEVVCEVRFRSEVRKVLVRRDRLVVFLDLTVPGIQTYVYMLATLRPVVGIETLYNPNGVGAMSYGKDVFVLATVDKQPGVVRVEDFYNGGVRRQKVHEGGLSVLSVEFEGRWGASASEQGTIVRVFDCKSLEILYELRRGTVPARISSIAFSPGMGYLVVASDRSTVHLWKLQKPTESRFWGVVNEYLPGLFYYERSTAKICLEPQVRESCPYTIDCGPVAEFLTDHDFCVAHLDGLLYHFSVKRGSIIPTGSTSFLCPKGR